MALNRTTKTAKTTTRAALVAVAAVASIGVLTGCAAGSSSTAAGAASTKSGGTSSKSSAPYTDAQACGWLKENLPTIPATGIVAEAQLTMGLSSFFEEHGGLQNADGYALDAALSRGCPSVRAAALKKAQITSFGDL